MIKRVLCFALAAAMATVAAPLIRAAGQTHAPTPSVWALSLRETDFGSGPKMKSDVIHLTTDTEKWLKYTDVTVDADGKPWNTSWSGLQDGTWKPLAGMPGAKASYETEDDSGHMVLPDGSTSDSIFSLSDDKKKVTFKVTGKTRDGKRYSQTLVYARTK